MRQMCLHPFVRGKDTSAKTTLLETTFLRTFERMARGISEEEVCWEGGTWGRVSAGRVFLAGIPPPSEARCGANSVSRGSSNRISLHAAYGVLEVRRGVLITRVLKGH